MPAAMLTSAKGAIAKLALVFPLWSICRLFSGRVIGRAGRAWGHYLGRMLGSMGRLRDNSCVSIEYRR